MSEIAQRRADVAMRRAMHLPEAFDLPLRPRDGLGVFSVAANIPDLDAERGGGALLRKTKGWRDSCPPIARGTWKVSIGDGIS
jgi:hypothetical protein